MLSTDKLNFFNATFKKAFNECKVDDEVELTMTTHADHTIQTFVLGLGTKRNPGHKPGYFYVYRADLFEVELEEGEERKEGEEVETEVRYTLLGEFYFLSNGNIASYLTHPSVFSSKDFSRLMHTLLVATGVALADIR